MSYIYQHLREKNKRDYINMLSFVNQLFPGIHDNSLRFNLVGLDQLYISYKTLTTHIFVNLT